MKAIIETGGKQYTVTEGTEIYVEKVAGEAGDTVTFDKVLMIGSEVGNPYLEGAKVTAKVLKHGKNKKIRIFKYVSKQKSTRKTQGHRQPYTKLEITKITR